MAFSSLISSLSIVAVETGFESIGALIMIGLTSSG